MTVTPLEVPVACAPLWSSASLRLLGLTLLPRPPRRARTPSRRLAMTLSPKPRAPLAHLRPPPCLPLRHSCLGPAHLVVPSPSPRSRPTLPCASRQRLCLANVVKTQLLLVVLLAPPISLLGCGGVDHTPGVVSMSSSLGNPSGLSPTSVSSLKNHPAQPFSTTHPHPPSPSPPRRRRHFHCC